MDGNYEIGLDHIRALAIECHAYDVQFDSLFNQETICGTTERIYRTYKRLFSTALLNLAISIRISLSNEAEYSKNGIVTPAALFLDGNSEASDFSIKDICDKLIHANSIWKPIEPGVGGACCELSGTYRREKWVLGLGVQIFCEYVLKWVDEIESRRTVAPPG